MSWSVAAILWSIASVGGWAWTTRYEFATHPDNNLRRAEQWPTASRLALAEDRQTLLFFIHSRCPCTRASVHELERVLTGTGLSESQLPKLIVVASLPPDASNKWARHRHFTPDLHAASRGNILDVGGTESSRFGATTSAR